MGNNTIIYLTNTSTILYQKTLEFDFYSKIFLLIILLAYAFILFKFIKTFEIDKLWKQVVVFLSKIYYISFFISLPLFIGFLTSSLTYWFFVKYLFIFYSILAIIVLIISFIFGGEYILKFFIDYDLQSKGGKK